MIALYTSSISLVSGGIENTSYLLCKGFCGSTDVIAAPMTITKDLSELDVQVMGSKGKSNKALRYMQLFHNHFRNRSKIDYSLCLTWKYAIVPHIIKKFFNKPFGVMMHGSDILPIDNARGLKASILNKLRRQILSNADHLFANSNYTRELFEKNFNGLNAIVIHPPISYTEPMPRDNDTFNHVLFSIGRTETRKGFQDCIEAVAIIKDSFPNIEYRIAGTGPYLDELKKIVTEKHLETWVKFLGRISEEEKIRQYQEADIVMMPSRTESSSVEGFGIVFVEANMYGCPALGSDSGGIADAIIDGKTGWIVPEGQSDLISEYVLRYYKADIGIYRKDLYEWGLEHSYRNIATLYLKQIKL